MVTTTSHYEQHRSSADIIICFIQPTPSFTFFLLPASQDKFAISKPVTIEKDDGLKQLSFHVLTTGSGATSLQLHCRYRLPAYMIPAVFVAVSGKWPVGRTGKKDTTVLLDYYKSFLKKQKEEKKNCVTATGQKSDMEEIKHGLDEYEQNTIYSKITTPSNPQLLLACDNESSHGHNKDPLENVQQDAVVTEVENIVAEVWCDVLGIVRVLLWTFKDYLSSMRFCLIVCE